MCRSKKLISVFLGLIISISLFPNFAQGEEVNAAFLYQEAVSLLKEAPLSVAEKIEKIVQEGWIVDSQGVEEYIAKNKKAIGKFKEATKLNYCDFIYPPNYAEISKLAKLTIVEAELFEREKKLGLALGNYLAVLRFISHLERQKRFVLLSKFCAIQLQGLLFERLSEYIDQDGLTREDYSSLLSVLISLRNSKTGLEDAFIEEKENMKNMKKVVMAQTKEKGVYNQEFCQKFYSEFDRLADKFYGYLIIAFQENNPQYYEEKITRFRKELEKETKPLNIARNILRDLKGGFFKKTPSLVAKVLLSVAMPPVSGTITKYYVSLAELNILITAVAIKLYEIDKSKPPDRLEDLVPKYIPRVFKDPFNNFKPLTYRKSKTGWLIYSFGPDKKDNLGKVEYDYKRPPKGDIVFLSS